MNKELGHRIKELRNTRADCRTDRNKQAKVCTD